MLAYLTLSLGSTYLRFAKIKINKLRGETQRDTDNVGLLVTHAKVNSTKDCKGGERRIIALQVSVLQPSILVKVQLFPYPP